MIKINAKGKVCPIPLIEAKKALKEIEKDGTVAVVVDNETAKENLEKMAKELGHKFNSKTLKKDEYEVVIIKGSGNNETYETEDYEDKGIEKDANTIVVISSNKMGEGNDELGEVLMKGFIYALTELEKLPSSIIFYNGGAKLSTKGSPVLEDIKKLEKIGVEILTCGTCLNYYNLTEDLEVGKITNMYAIAEKMQKAGKIIKP